MNNRDKGGRGDRTSYSLESSQLERVRLTMRAENVRITQTLDKRAKEGKLSGREAKSSLISCWQVPSQMSWVLEEFSSKPLEDIQQCSSQSERRSMITDIPAI